MAHGFLQSFDSGLFVRSAGTEPADQVNPKAIRAMKEAGIDISHHVPVHIDQYIGEEWDYVITVCDQANETCPVFTGKVIHRLHYGFEDPSKATGSEEFIWSEFQRTRNQIKKKFYDLWISRLKHET
jgi:arsenate reductase